MCLYALWWLAMLLAFHFGLNPTWVVPPALAHGLIFTFGFMPAFMAGFLFTAGPRWLALPAVDARDLLAPLVQLGNGWLIALIGIHVGELLAAFGVATAVCGWLRLNLRFASLLRASRVLDRQHVRWVLAAGIVGVAAMLLACAAMVQNDSTLLRAAVQLGLWGFVGPVYAVVSHRMVPFFSAAGQPGREDCCPYAPLQLMLGGLALVGLAEMEFLPPLLPAVLLAIASMAVLTVALRWVLTHSLKGESRRLLAMLYGGFVWFGLALGLQAVSLALQAAGRSDLGAVPLHAFSLGWLGSTLFAMVTRVAAGHSGRPLAIDRLAWATYLLLQLGVLLRVATALGWQEPIALVCSAAVWAVVSTTWGVRCLGWLSRSRVDGRPD
jgi:uncharacterized protein involved in response to NO